MTVKLLKIRKPLALVFLLAWIALVLLSFLHFFDLQRRQETAFAVDKSTKLSKEFKLEIAENAQRLEALISFVARDQSVIQSYLKGDRERLIEHLANQFDRLKLRRQVTHVYFHTPSATNFLRLHKPEKFGDLIERVTLQEAISTGKTQAGLELGTLGHFVLRVVQPWRYQGKIIGYIEFGEEIEEVIKRLAQADNYELFLGIKKDYLAELKNQNRSSTMALKNQRWTFNKHIITTQHSRYENSIPEAFINQYELGDANIIEKSGQYYVVAAANIYDVQSILAGNLFFVSNVTESLDSANNVFIRYLVWSLPLGALLYFAVSFYTEKTQRRLSVVAELNSENSKLVTQHSSLLATHELLKQKLDNHQRSLNESKIRYQSLFERTTDALLLIEGNSFIDCNQATLDMLGYSTKEELYNTHPSKLSPPTQPDGRDSMEKADEMIAIAFQKGSHRFEWAHVRRNGEVFPVEVLLTSIPYGEKNLLYTVWRDITARKKTEEEVRFLAQYDPLTGLPNRRLLFERLNDARTKAIEKGIFHAALFIDLDRFKNINDSMGHSVGDNLLISSARRIKSQLRDKDTLARFGGDEFVVLIRDLGPDLKHAGLYSERIAESILQKFQIPIAVSQFDMQVSLSIGISIFPLENESIDEVLRHADMAMYRAKEGGRNQVAFFASSMQEDVIRRLNIEKDMHDAIKYREIAVFYQPQVSPTGEIIGVEALARWQHPHYGFISPEEFVHIAEETGQIIELGNLVMEKAVTDLQALGQETGVSLNLSLNISPRQLSFSDFLPSVISLLRHYKVKPSAVTLEITESVMAENFASISAKLSELKGMGVRISLDDFGTGYSSLSYLKRLPLDELKIDRSFVMELHSDQANLNLVSTIISIGHQFGLAVVAEGVENDRQLEFLRSQNCGLYQGYFFSKPVPFETLTRMVKKDSSHSLKLAK